MVDWTYAFLEIRPFYGCSVERNKQEKFVHRDSHKFLNKAYASNHDEREKLDWDLFPKTKSIQHLKRLEITRHYSANLQNKQTKFI